MRDWTDYLLIALIIITIAGFIVLGSMDKEILRSMGGISSAVEGLHSDVIRSLIVP